jgi:hypothetical protein
MKTIFICSPYSGNLEYNIGRARKLCLLAVNEGHAPFAPHLFYTQFLNDTNPLQRTMGMNCGLVFLGMCDELWYLDVVPKLSEGMLIEMEHARALNIPCIPRTV